MNSRVTNLKGEGGPTFLTSTEGAVDGPFEAFVPFADTTFTVCDVANKRGANPTSITFPKGVPQFGIFTKLHVATGGVTAYRQASH